MKQLAIVFCIVCVFTECVRSIKHANNDMKIDNEKQVAKVLKGLIEDRKLDGIGACIVIPRAGCSGCIQSALLYCKRNIDSFKNTVVALTDMGDRNLVKMQMGASFLENNKVVLDTANLIYNVYDFPYPTIFYFDNEYELKKQEIFDYDKIDVTKRIQ